MKLHMLNSNTILPKEMKLLVCLSVNNISGEQQRLVHELLYKPINWEDFFNRAVKNKVHPIVYKNIKKLNINCIDKQVLTKFELICKINQLASLKLAAELIKVLELIEKQNMKAIFIKGPLLSMSLYQDVSMRASRDLDILVKPSDIFVIDKILEEAGYTKDSTMIPLTLKQRKLYYKTFHHLAYVNNEGVQLELHWRLSEDYYNIPFKEVWRKSKETKMFGKSFRILSEEENLVYLIFHGSKHGWKRLRWICDIFEIINKENLDWEYLKKRSEELGILHMVEQTILLLKKIYHSQPHIQLPLTEKERRIARRLAVLSIPFINSLDGEAEMFGHHLFYQYNRYLFSWYRSIKKRLHFIKTHFLPNTEDFQRIALTDKYFFLYYILRLYKIVMKCVKAFVKRKEKVL